MPCVSPAVRMWLFAIACGPLLSASIAEGIPFTPSDILQPHRLRNAIVVRQQLALETLSLMPGTPWLLPGLGRDQVLHAMGAIWPDVFGNTIVVTTELDDGLTGALYYNPLLDVAVLTRWRHADGSAMASEMLSMGALPGENLGADHALAVPQEPIWMRNPDPIGTLFDKTRERVADFGRTTYENGSSEDYGLAVNGMRAIVPRLHWLVEQKSQWADAKWLMPLTIAVEDDLGMQDPTELVARAPESSVEVATALSSLDRRRVSQLRLDVVLEQGRSRLAVFSNTHDGRYYLFVKCHLISDDTRCVPVQYLWTDVMGDSHGR